MSTKPARELVQDICLKLNVDQDRFEGALNIFVEETGLGNTENTVYTYVLQQKQCRFLRQSEQKIHVVDLRLDNVLNIFLEGS